VSTKIDYRGKQLIGYLICLFGFGLTLWAFYPGMLSSDSIASLGEGRSGVIYDQNSAVMSYLLGWLDSIVTGTGLMLVLQAAVFWIAIGLLWRAVYRTSLVAGLAIVAFPFLPQILSQIPVIWKDVGMAIALLMTVALVFLAKKTGSKAALLLSPIFLFYGFAARLNSLPAVLPIAMWSGFVAVSLFQMRSGWTSTAVGVAYFVVMFGLVQIFNIAVTEGRTSYPVQFVLLHDLGAIAVATGEANFPDYVMQRENFSIDAVRARYMPTTIGGLVYANPDQPGDAPPLAVTEDASKFRELRSTWWNAVTTNPLIYLTHRLKVFAQLIGISRSVTNQYCDVSYNPPEFRITENPAGRFLKGYFGIFRRPVMQTFFFRGFIWLSLCGFFGYVALKARLRRDWDFVFVLATSALLYTAAYFVTAPAADFRYIFWPAIASGLAIIFGIYLLRQEKAIPAAEA
jgi:hypothetical protein